MITLICQQCGKNYDVMPYRKNITKYCSVNCRYPAITALCECCGKTYRIWPSRKTRSKYCSKICQNGEQTFAQRFWKKVYIKSPQECWEWRRYINHGGYGVAGERRQGINTAHRIAYKLTYGDIPNGMHVLHHCDNRSCVNPAHLFLGTNNDNIQDMVTKMRQAFGEKHPKHKLSEQDVITIRLLYHTTDTTYNALATKFGISKETISGIIAGRIWKHLPLYPSTSEAPSSIPHP